MLAKPRKATKTTVIFEKLRQDIICNRLRPGERLPLSSLKERYHVGGSPLREALTRLAAQGLVEGEEQCGYRVAALSVSELRDLYTARETIETRALELAIELGDEVWESDVVAYLHRLNKYLDASSPSASVEPLEWEKRQRDFLSAIVKGSQSNWLVKMHEMLYDQSVRYRMLCLHKHYQDKTLLGMFINENQTLIEAITARDKTRAQKIRHEAWLKNVRSITQILEEKEYT
jgi:GntR family carbon starvation induced transcriptional regulator